MQQSPPQFPNHPSSKRPSCLFIAPIKDIEALARKRSEDVYENLVKAAATRAGFTPKFIFSNDPGTILLNIFEQISKACVIVADMTTGNGSVLYELGAAHSLKKPTVLLIQEGYTIPYDLRDVRHVSYSYTNCVAPGKSMNKLFEQLKHYQKTWWCTPADNPIVNALRVVNDKNRTELPALRPPVAITPPPPSTSLLHTILEQPKQPSISLGDLMQEYRAVPETKPAESIFDAMRRYGVPEK